MKYKTTTQCLGFLLVAAVLTACSSNIALTKRDGTVIRGQVVRSTHDTVRVLGSVKEEGTPHAYGTVTVQREHIVDADHPGTGLIAGGVATAAAAVLLGGLGINQLDRASDSKDGE